MPEFEPMQNTTSMEQGQQIFRPIPDPTELTNQAVAAAKEELRRELQAVRDIIQMRLDASDKAVILLQTAHDRIPDHMDKLASQNILLVQQRFLTQEAKFEAIQEQFASLAERRLQDHAIAKEGMATALQAAKEVIVTQHAASAQAIQKSEASMDKRIDETIRMAQAAAAALDARITVLAEASKNIMTRQEVEQLFRTLMDKLDGPTGLAMRFENLVARTSGRAEQARENTGQNQWVMGAVLGGLGLLLALASLMLKQM